MTKINSPGNSSNNSAAGTTPVASSNQTTDTPIETSQSRSIAPSVLPLLLLIVGLLALSSTAIFIKLSIREISAEATVFNRLWMATILFASWNWGWQRWQSQKGLSDEAIAVKTQETSSAEVDRPGTWIVVGLLIALALVQLMGRFLWTWSLTQTTAANGAMLANMPPLFTALGGWLFLGQRFDRRFLTGLAIAVGGAIVLTLGDWLHPEEQLFGTRAIIGDSAALLSSVFYAGSFLLVEKLRQRLSTSAILVWRCALGLAICAPLVFIFDDPIFPISTTGWLAVLGLAAISEVMGHGLIVYSLKHFSSAFVTIVLLLEPAPVAIVGWILLGEFISSLNILGFILISAGIYLAKTGEGSDSGNQKTLPTKIQEDLVEAAIEP